MVLDKPNKNKCVFAYKKYYTDVIIWFVLCERSGHG